MLNEATRTENMPIGQSRNAARNNAGGRKAGSEACTMVCKSIVTLGTLMVMFLIGAILTPSATQSQTACEARDKITSALKKDYAELPVSAGLDNAGRMIEVFASNEGSRTILLTMPSCFTASSTPSLTGHGNRSP